MSRRRIIAKLGTSTLTTGTKRLSAPHLIELVRQLAVLHAEGNQVIVISSGAMAAGRETLDFPDLPKFVPSKQMLSAIGQPRLMALYSQLFGFYGETVAQVLLTRADLADRRRYINARNTLESLLEQQVIPIVNENDTVATEEIRLSDNDVLSALVANLVEADLLVLLTDQKGLFTADPRISADATLVLDVQTPEIPESLWKAAGGTSSGLGRGGMVTKLHAADLARRSGTTVLIADGREPDILLRIAKGEPVGTRLSPVHSTLESRKRYMLAGMQTSDGVIRIDTGAAKAIIKGGSLLPVGMKALEGEFERGDTVRVIDPEANEIAMGLVNYNARNLQQLCGIHSAEIESILGYTFGDEVIHHNNMLLL